MEEKIISEDFANSLKLKTDPIVRCNVWCVRSSKQEIDLGLPEGDSWMPIAIDFSQIIAIKLAGENDFIGNDKPVIYLSGSENFTIDIPFQKAVNMWRGAHK